VNYRAWTSSPKDLVFSHLFPVYTCAIIFRHISVIILFPDRPFSSKILYASLVYLLLAACSTNSSS